jgi:hypothetical protein
MISTNCYIFKVITYFCFMTVCHNLCSKVSIHHPLLSSAHIRVKFKILTKFAWISHEILLIRICGLTRINCTSSKL